MVLSSYNRVIAELELKCRFPPLVYLHIMGLTQFNQYTRTNKSMNLTEEILKGNPRAVAKGISMVENDSHGSRKMMTELFPHSDGLGFLKNFTFCLDSGSNDNLGNLHLFDILCSKISHRSAQSADKILRAVVKGSRAKQYLA